MTMHRLSGPAADTLASAPRAWVSARAGRKARRAERADHRAIARELADYSTPADQLEIDAILSRHDTAEVRDIQQIVLRSRLVA